MASGASETVEMPAVCGRPVRRMTDAVIASLPVEERKRRCYESVRKGLRRFFAKYRVGLVGRMATLNSYLKMAFPSIWFVGFYTVKEPGRMLEIGAYQGEVLACGLIEFGKGAFVKRRPELVPRLDDVIFPSPPPFADCAGVCGTAAAARKVVVVDDVSKIENYIACDEETQSEVVVPVEGATADDLVGVLDVDSSELAAFDALDSEELTSLCDEFITRFLRDGESSAAVDEA